MKEGLNEGREWSRGEEPLRSREGYSELTDTGGSYLEAIWIPSRLLEPLSG